MEYIKVAQTTEIENGDKKKIDLGDTILLLVNIEGVYYAIDNRCPHMGGSLYDGVLEGSNIICPRHKTVFDIKTGKVVTNGKLAFIHLKVHDATSFDVKVEGTDIFVAYK